jgi:NADPH-dependent glutamate synthase beta subunit-like oxidoreductase
MAVEKFIIELFDLIDHVENYYDMHHSYRLASHFKRNFIQRDAFHAYQSVDHIDGDVILDRLSKNLGQPINPTNEVSFAKLGLAALSREDSNTVELFRQYAAWAYYSEDGQKRHHDGFLFKKPSLTNPHLRFPVIEKNGCIINPTLQGREGFDLTDKGISTEKAVDEAFYCIKCHERNKDSCRSGMKPDNNDFQKDIYHQPLSGCPLDQKISEMNVLFEHGQVIAALAVVTLDNPMVAATGHRICYDCSRSCIFQKQDPVDIPSIETRLLKQVLELPYGFEIYSLLTRWNPLNLEHPYSKTDSGYHVLIVGQGPSGFALAHLMMQYGHQVTAIDGLRIEPLPEELKDVSVPIKNISQYYQKLSDRYAKGFGGVAEYGITVRWDKNFLFIVRLLLERRQQYRCLDGVRFGSSITFDDAFNVYKFDHVALCLGAGSPTMLPLENITTPGVRLASDFLMALHLGDAAKLNSKTTLRMQLPAVVIGAGLTAVDAATEALAYYPIQVMNFYRRYNQIVERHGQVSASKLIDIESDVASIFLEHGRILQEELDAAKLEKRSPNYLPYLDQWGGVTIHYRKSLQDSPAYRLNPHELKNALAEGVRFVEHSEPINILTDASDRLKALEFNIRNQKKSIPVKTLLIAAGTKPNIVLAEEFSELKVNGIFFESLIDHPFFIASTPRGHYTSYLGDLHPQYSGSVVKALASAKAAAPLIHEAMCSQPPQHSKININDFISIVQYIAVHDNIIHLEILSPAAAKTYRPGQFFKLQPYEVEFTEAIPLLPINIDSVNGIVEFKVEVVGATTRSLKKLKIKQRVFMMGPTGSKLEIPSNHRVLFIIDPSTTSDITYPIRVHFSEPPHQLITDIESLEYKDFDGIDSLFLVGDENYITGFKQRYSDINLPCYTFIPTHLQCMMKEVCAQCIYTIKDPITGFVSIQFGCAKNVANIERISYRAINKRNKNEKLEEVLLDACFTDIK